VRPFDPAVVRRSRGGLLLLLRPDPAAGLAELGRVVLAPDAWGLAVTPDRRRAIVTSAWSAEATLVDIPSTKVIATVKTSREPRGVAIAPDGKTAYVSHLVGAALTKLAIMDDRLEAVAVALPAAPARTPPGVTLEASLGYALVFSPDAASLYAPRHALGAEGVGAWWGAPSVDVLDLPSGKPVAPFRAARSPGARVSTEHVRPAAPWEASPGQAPAANSALVQPRAAVYRRSRDTLLVASEGWDTLTEVDALAADPAMAITRVHPLTPAYDPFGGFPDQGGAPTGIALTRDDEVAYVYCRTTFDVVRVELDSGRLARLHLADDGLPADAAYGRRLYTNARNSAVSGGLGCAACHPEGRDDGYVWREIGAGEEARFIGLRQNARFNSAFENRPPERREVFPRQTPMLAGRVRANGPFGWHAENPDILDRLLAGFRLHRAAWDFSPADRSAGEHVAKIDYLADYLRSGLVPPPTLAREPSAIEQRGKAVFESPRTGCTRCHLPGTEFTDRTGTALRALPVRASFDAETAKTFKTPSLWFVGGTAPYFHDGSARTLEDLVRTNGDRMGDTRHLTPEEQAALVAYLRML
jgi:mono/diheme cytochrome c family protein